MQQYHVLLKGFEITKNSRDETHAGSVVRTDLRHYRYDQPDYTITNENGSYLVRLKGSKDWVAAFPVNATTILLEEKQEDHR